MVVADKKKNMEELKSLGLPKEVALNYNIYREKMKKKIHGICIAVVY